MTPLPVREVVYLKSGKIFLISFYGKNIVAGTVVTPDGKKERKAISMEVYKSSIEILLKNDPLFKLIQELNKGLTPPHIVIVEYTHNESI